MSSRACPCTFSFFFFNDTATTEIYTLSLHDALPILPLHIRNAPTKLMEELGYGAGYQYAHAFEHAYVPQEYLPDSLRGASWYQPTAAGYEKTIGERMEFWKQLKEKLLRDAGSGRREGEMHRRIPHLASRIPIIALLCVACATLGRLAVTVPDVEL